MKEFRGILIVSPYPDGVTWYLDRDLVYHHKSGAIRVPKGFETDFASVPRFVTNIFPRWGMYGLASIVHDWLYWNQKTRRYADDTFLSAMAYLEVPKTTRLTLYWAVRLFGWKAWRENARIAGQGYSRVRTRQSPPRPAWRR